MTLYLIIGFYLTLFVTPILAIILRNRIKQYRNKLFVLTAVAVFVVIVFQWLGVSLRGEVGDVVFLHIIYMMVGLCVGQLIWSRHVLAKIIGGTSAMLFLIAPLLSLPGFLFVALTFDSISPDYTVDNEQGHLCRVTAVYRGDNRRNKAALYKVFGLIEYQLQITNKADAEESLLAPEKLCASIFSSL